MVKGGCFKNPLYLIIGLLLVIIAMLIISNYTNNSQRKNIMEKFINTEQRCKDAGINYEIEMCKNIITEYNNCHAKNIKKEECDDLKKECKKRDDHCNELRDRMDSPCHELDEAINGVFNKGGFMCLFE